MSGALFIALVVTALAAAGGRDQLLVARMRTAGGGAAVLVVGAVCAAVCAAVAAWAGGSLDAMISDAAEDMLVAFALGLAALELLWPHRERQASEPTHSLGALGIVLLARQIGDGARFCIVAIAAATGAPLLAGMGGAIGGAAAIALGWSMGADLECKVPLRAIRLVVGAVLLVGGLVIALNARGILG